MSEVQIVMSPTPGLYEARLVVDAKARLPELVGVGHDATRACIDLLTKIGDHGESGPLAKSETRVSDPGPELDFTGSKVWCWEQDGQENAKIDGIAAGGTGKTKSQAILSLCDLLGSFVMGHASTIAELRALLTEHGIEDPTSKLPGTDTSLAEKNHKLLREHALKSGAAQTPELDEPGLAVDVTPK